LGQNKDFFIELQDIIKIVEKDPSSVPASVKKRFWKIVGKIKRDPSPDKQEVELASRIRDIMYVERLGSPKPLGLTISLWTFCGIGFMVISVLTRMPGMLESSMFLSLAILTLFTIGYGWILNLGKERTLLLVVIMIGPTVIIYLLILYFFTDLLILIPYMMMFITVPCLYPIGRLVGGIIAGIDFDGMTRDVFFLPTLKINYRSYLLAKAPKRQWIFFCGGIGTVITSVMLGTIHFIFFNDPLFNIFGIGLALGELMDFLGLAGPLSGGEMNHLKRETIIVRDWKKNLSGKT
jgi:hypothetical protein